MKRSINIFLFCLFVVALGISVTLNDSYADEPLKITLGGASVGGFWSTIGEAIGSTIRKEYPNASFSYEPGSGLGNIKKVSEKTIELGIAYSAECTLGLNGQPPFNQKYDKIKAIFTCIPNSVFHIVATKSFLEEYGVTKLSDIAKNKIPVRMSVNQKGNINEAVYRTVLEAVGMKYDDIESWGGKIYYQPLTRTKDLIKDRRCDTMGAGTFAPESNTLDVSISHKMGMLYLDDAVVDRMINVWKEKEAIIPAGTYDFQDKPYRTMYMKTLIICDESLPDDIAYKVAKSIHKHFDIIKSIHKMMNNSDLISMVNDTSPLELHPGAIKYYKEAGLLK